METYSPSLQVIIDDCMVMNMSYLLLFHPCPELIFFYDKVRMQRVVWLNEHALSEYTAQRAELKLLRILPNCTISDLFRDFSLTFFLIECEISEQASRQVATEEIKKG